MPPPAGLPPTPPPPPGAGMPGPGGTSPAMPQQADRGGKEARGKVVAGLGLEMLRIAIPLLGNSKMGLIVSECVSKLGREVSKPPADLGAAELKFMESQLGAGGAGPQGGAPKPMQGMPPTPAPPPGMMPQGAPGGEMAA